VLVKVSIVVMLTLAVSKPSEPSGPPIDRGQGRGTGVITHGAGQHRHVRHDPIPAKHGDVGDHAGVPSDSPSARTGDRPGSGEGEL
jgi:hypothetical protein